jgi:hypothetical protein
MELPGRMSSGEEPRARDALIGAAFGALLIWLGRLVPLRLVSWPMIGIGVLFVLVMALFLLVTLYHHASPPLLRILRRVRGHVREDPRLGTLTRDARARCWSATVMCRAVPVEVIVDGDEEPSPALLARARNLVADFETLSERVGDYLAAEARELAESEPELSAEITSLQMSAIVLRSEHPDRVQIDFEGPDEIRFWRCDYENGQLSELWFDS